MLYIVWRNKVGQYSNIEFEACKPCLCPTMSPYQCRWTFLLQCYQVVMNLAARIEGAYWLVIYEYAEIPMCI